VVRTGDGATAAITIAAKPMWAHARVVAASFRRHHPDIEMFAVLADEPGGELDVTLEPFPVITLDDLGRDLVGDLPIRYGQQAFSYALTPLALRWLLGKGYRRVVFIKQESMVRGGLDPVFDALDGHSAVVVPHLLAPLGGDAAAIRELNVLQSGVFNGGVVGIAAGEETDRLLGWWADRVSRHCHLDVDRALHFEQRWLDLAPSYFPGVHVLADATIGVGHWNIDQRQHDCAAFRLFRVSGFDPLVPDTITRYHRRIEMSDIGPAAELFAAFTEMMFECGHEHCRRWPYAFARFPDGTLIPELGRMVYDTWPGRRAGAEAMQPEALHCFREWLVAPSRQCPAGPLWQAVYRRRADLREAFGPVGGESSPQFRRWIDQHGCAEFEIDPRLALA
jgi:hypothetical protein